MKQNFSSEITLTALCYALIQAYDNRICITQERADEDDAEQLAQLKELVQVITETIDDGGIDKIMLEDIRWYNAEIIELVSTATKLDDCYGRPDTTEQNMPCDDYGPTACTADCPKYFECNK